MLEDIGPSPVTGDLVNNVSPQIALLRRGNGHDQCERSKELDEQEG